MKKPIWLWQWKFEWRHFICLLWFHVFSLKPLSAFPLNARPLFSKLVKLLQAYIWSVNFTNYCYCFFSWGMGSNGQLGQSTDEEDAWEPGTMLGKQLEQRKVMAVSGGGQHTVLIAQGICFLFVWMHATLCFYWRSWACPL